MGRTPPLPLLLYGAARVRAGLAGPPFALAPKLGRPPLGPFALRLAGLAHMGHCVVRLAQVASCTPLVHVGPISYVGPTSRLL